MIKIYPLYEVTLIAVFTIIKTNLDCDLIWANGVGIFCFWMRSMFAETNEALYGTRTVIKLEKVLIVAWLSSFFTNLSLWKHFLSTAQIRQIKEKSSFPLLCSPQAMQQSSRIFIMKAKEIFFGTTSSKHALQIQGRLIILLFVSSS